MEVKQEIRQNSVVGNSLDIMYIDKVEVLEIDFISVKLQIDKRN